MALASIMPLMQNSAAAEDTPLIVIRFNSNVVDYGKNLDKAVKMALKEKPTTYFDLIALSPETTDSRKNNQFKKELKILADKVKSRISGNGVSEDMIRITLQKSNQITYNEIQIFVQ